MADPKITVQVTEAITRVRRVLLSEDEAANILRNYFGFRKEAEVTFECHRDFLNHIQIEEREVTERAQPPEERSTP